ncbi:MAG: hypothetical protein U5K72_00830 [Balneolaceae bacterium]|nr:hypothetical protein [Balneolaceae bacterium]
MAQEYKQQGVVGLFGKHYRLKKLSSQGDPLEKLNRVPKIRKQYIKRAKKAAECC